MVTEAVRERLVAQIYVKLDGSSLPSAVADDLTSATVDGSVHLPDMATLEFRNQDLDLLKGQQFKPGQELKIELGDASSSREVFIGEVTSVELDIRTSGETPLVVRAYDRAHHLQRGRFTKAFTNMKDSDIAGEIARALSFSADVDSTREVHEYVLQDNQTNWEFLQERASRLGFELQVRDKTLKFKRPPSDPAEPVKLALQTELLAFRARLTTSDQVNEVEVRGLDPREGKEVVGLATRPQGTPRLSDTRSGGQAASDAFHREARVAVAREPVYSQAQADGLAQTVLNDLASTFVTAEGVAMGNPRLRLGSEVELPEESVGKQFNARYVVTEIRHVYDPKGYRIEFKASGRRSTDIVSLLSDKPGHTHKPGPGTGMQMAFTTIGRVTNTQDPWEVGRVKVKLLGLPGTPESDWCDVVAPGAGKERGIEYLPEVNDLVLLMGASANSPNVLGGLWSYGDPPPLKNSEAQSGGQTVKRIIRSRTGHVILLDDSDGGGGITIMDSTEKNKVVIDTEKGGLLLTAGSIRLEAGGKLELVAGEDIVIDAGANLKATAGAGATVEAGARLELKGPAGAKLDGGAMAEIKGAMVNIG